MCVSPLHLCKFQCVCAGCLVTLKYVNCRHKAPHSQNVLLKRASKQQMQISLCLVSDLYGSQQNCTAHIAPQYGKNTACSHRRRRRRCRCRRAHSSLEGSSQRCMSRCREKVHRDAANGPCAAPDTAPKHTHLHIKTCNDMIAVNERWGTHREGRQRSTAHIRQDIAWIQ
jgi:hypothetical protein